MRTNNTYKTVAKVAVKPVGFDYGFAVGVLYDL